MRPVDIIGICFGGWPLSTQNYPDDPLRARVPEPQAANQTGPASESLSFGEMWAPYSIPGFPPLGTISKHNPPGVRTLRGRPGWLTVSQPWRLRSAAYWAKSSTSKPK